ncbi:MAG: hypothetical protein R3F38_10830 [Gammaproteobacteria bacterium]
MIRNHPLLPALAFLLGISTQVHADSFDDAVNQFLKGFDYCKEAKTHLSGNRIPQAQASLRQYQKLLEEATRINPDILSTSKRGMDGNLKFCQRVTRDVEVEAGMPTMNKALAACDAAQQALKDENPAKAQEDHAQFKQLRDEALQIAPSLGEIFSVKSQINRCERIENKIASFSQQQQALTLSLEAAQEASSAYVSSCQKTLENLKKELVDEPVLRDANQGIASAQSHKRNAREDRLANKAFQEDPQHPVKKTIDANIGRGDRCMAELNSTLEQKKSELEGVKRQFARYNEQLASANTQCEQSRKGAGGAPTQANYDNAKKDYERALQQRNSTRDALSKDNRYTAYEGREDVARIEQQLQKLNSCLDTTKTQLGALFAKLPSAAPAVAVAAPAPAPKTVATAVPAAAPVTAPVAAPAATSTPQAESTALEAPRQIKGTITMMGLAPELALFYVPDGSRPQEPEIVIERTGFEQALYIAPDKGSLSFKNKDNTAHRISANNDASGFSDNLTRLQPRQSKSAKVSWPVHSMVTLRSDRGTFPASYVANIPSANYLKLAFSGGSSVELDFSNASGATTAYLIMPDTDPLTFTLNKGETKSLALTRGGVPVGSLVVTGE